MAIPPQNKATLYQSDPVISSLADCLQDGRGDGTTRLYGASGLYQLVTAGEAACAAVAHSPSALSALSDALTLAGSADANDVKILEAASMTLCVLAVGGGKAGVAGTGEVVENIRRTMVTHEGLVQRTVDVMVKGTSKAQVSYHENCHSILFLN